jgi:hypothetical protein
LIGDAIGDSDAQPTTSDPVDDADDGAKRRESLSNPPVVNALMGVLKADIGRTQVVNLGGSASQCVTWSIGDPN